jgi:hypothetical protein
MRMQNPNIAILAFGIPLPLSKGELAWFLIKPGNGFLLRSESFRTFFLLALFFEDAGLIRHPQSIPA